MLRLFMSTDVAGSTGYKASHSHAVLKIGPGGVQREEPAWIDVFRSFFVHFPVLLTGQVFNEMIEEENPPEISVWKALGDEMIFTCAPQSAEETTLLLRAMYFAMAAYEGKFLKEMPLRLKGSAWIAEFPSPNVELEIPEASGAGGTLIDFIGPGIDLGFRIGKFSNPSAIVVSLDLLEIVLSARNSERLSFSLLGRQELKGVLFGRKYPIIWSRPSEAPFNFMPWEVEDQPLARKARKISATSPQALQQVIDDVRLYLRKMHGTDAPPLSFDKPRQET
jgi:hypothetical protein